MWQWRRSLHRLEASGGSLRDAIQFTLQGHCQCDQPFVIHHQCLDLVHAELWVFVVDQLVERGIRFLDLAFECALLVEQCQVANRGMQIYKIFRQRVGLESLLV